MENLLVLTIIIYGEKEGESYRVTLQPMNVAMVSSQETLVQRQGMSLNKVFIKFVEEGSAELYINGVDLLRLEEAVGCYGMEGMPF